MQMSEFEVESLPRVVFLSGIDTDAGKTYMTAWLLSELEKAGRRAISQKFVQTGCQGSSEDIEAHRRLTGKRPEPRDLDGTTAPVIFAYPASAQLAARLEGREIDIAAIDRSTEILAREYDNVIIEGAGGLMVPLTDDFLTIDYISSRKLPVVLVTNGILGSINHTILSLEALAARNIEVSLVMYNCHFDNADDPKIPDDTKGFVKRYLEKHFPATEMVTVPSLDADTLRSNQNTGEDGGR